MPLHFIVPEDSTFGDLKFGKFLGDTTRRQADGTNLTTRKYSLFSTRQVADDIVVTLPGKVPQKRLPFMTSVRLINCKITAVGKVTAGRAHREYELFADDIEKV